MSAAPYPTLRVPWAVVLLAAAVAALTTLKLLQERGQYSGADTYSTFDTMPGGYRAWYELLQRERVDVTRFEERAAFLDRATTALIVADPPPSSEAVVDIAPADAHYLAIWVSTGGRVLLLGDGAFVATARSALHLPLTAAGRKRDQTFTAPALRRLGVRSYAVADSVRWDARRSDTVLLRDRRGVVALQYPLGRGSVVAVVDGTPFRNASIGSPDHARLAYGLVALLGRGRSATVAFDEALHGDVVPERWWQVFPHSLVLAIVLGGVAVGVALAGAAVRLGPPRALEAERAPTSEEYLDALSALMRRARAADLCTRSTLACVRRAIALRAGVQSDAPAPHIASDIAVPEQREAFLDLDALSHYGERDLMRAAALAVAVEGRSSPP